MNVQATTPDRIPADTAVVVPTFKHDDLADLPDIERSGGDRLSAVLARGEATGALYETVLLHASGGSPAIALVGAGDRKDFDAMAMKRVIAAASRFLTGRKYAKLAIVDRGNLDAFGSGQAAVEGAMRGAYNNGIMKTSADSQRRLDEVLIISQRAQDQSLLDGIRVGEVIGRTSGVARDLINLPPNEITPSSLASRARTLAEENGLEIEILDEAAIRQKGMGALLGVAAGSSQPPRVIVLRHGNPTSQVKLAFVGKGLTFDSGGLSLKTAQGMESMKSDMSGAAAVIAGLIAVAQLGLGDISVTGYAGATENMPGGAAMRPGDVLTALNGETIEVLNTDAEGRLVLADVLALAVSQGATHLVDFATLTGGAVVALGHAATLAAGRPMDWVQQVVQAAAAGLERAWAMPLYPDYRVAMDSDVADIKNSGGRAGSPLTATAFLADFVGDVPWAHMDIAGTAFGDKAPYRASGATGEGVATIVSLVRQMSQS